MSDMLLTLARFIENCDKGEAELLSQYCNYLKNFIPKSVQYQDFYHWCLSREDRKKLSGEDCEDND